MVNEDKAILKTVRDDLKMGKPIIQTIWNRLEEKDKETVELFKINTCKIINPRSFRFENLYELYNLEDGVKLLSNKIKNKERIVLITDYDCDGISCAAIASRFFRDIYKYPVEVYVNKRMFGNGVNEKILEEIPNLQDIHLLITADHGSVDDERYLKLKEINKDIKILVTDHHTFVNEPKNCDVFINNQHPNNEVYKEFSGCGIFCCLLRGLLDNFDIPDIKRIEAINLFQSFMALTLVSDVMCMRNEDNRYIVKKGIPKLYKLLNLDFINTDLIYKLIPMINSGNRMHQEDLSYNYLTTNDDIEREFLFKELSSLNERRKEITKETMDSIIINKEKIKVVKINSIYGINGLIAGKISDQYNTPSFCLQNDGSGILHGSSRGNGADILKMLKSAYDNGLLIKYGGHKNAAGFSLHNEKYEDFFNFITKQEVEKEYTEYVSDVYLNSVDVTKIILSKSLLFPFGKNFEEPIFESNVTLCKLCSVNDEIYTLMFNSQGNIFFAKYRNIYNKNLQQFLIKGRRYRIKFTVMGSHGSIGVNILEMESR